MKNTARRITFVGLFLCGLPGLVLGSDFYVYPGQGQSKKQQEQDEYRCYEWAKGETGFDPMERPTASTPPPQAGARQGGLLRGGARGAALGAVVGAIAGDAGKGAAMGAAGGALFGGMRRRDQMRQESQDQQNWAAQESARYEQQRGSYNRAYRACLIGRGYTVE